MTEHTPVYEVEVLITYRNGRVDESFDDWAERVAQNTALGRADQVTFDGHHETAVATVDAYAVESQAEAYHQAASVVETQLEAAFCETGVDCSFNYAERVA